MVFPYDDVLPRLDEEEEEEDGAFILFGPPFTVPHCLHWTLDFLGIFSIKKAERARLGIFDKIQKESKKFDKINYILKRCR
jgi:hypothetical protein